MTFSRERFNDPFRFSGASASKSAAQTGINTSATVTFNGVHWDTDSYFDNANDQFVIPTGFDGYFRVTVIVATLNNSGDAWPDVVYTSSETNPASIRLDRQASSNPHAGGGSVVLKLAAGDSVRCIANGDAAFDVRETTNGTVFQIERLGS